MSMSEWFRPLTYGRSAGAGMPRGERALRTLAVVWLKPDWSPKKTSSGSSSGFQLRKAAASRR